MAGEEVDDELMVIVIGPGCAICGAVLSDFWPKINESSPFIIDKRLLELVRREEFGEVNVILREALRRWDAVQKRFQANMNADGREYSDEVVPFMITGRGEFIANEVYEELDRRCRGSK